MTPHLEPFLLRIAVAQGLLPREKAEELLRQPGTHRERLLRAGFTADQIDAAARKHADFIERRRDAAVALEAQHLGYVSKEAAEECVKALREFEKKGFAFRLGELMIKRGLLTPQILGEVEESIEKQIILCPACLALARNPKKAEIADYTCPKCHAKFHPMSFGATSTTYQEAPTVPPVAMDPLPHQAPDRMGDFRIVRELGRGGMGIVYEAEQVSLKRRVALKVAPPSLALNEEAMQRFHREAQALAKIRHPNIVQIYENGESGGHHYYAMEFVDGRGVDDMIRETKKDPKLAAKIAAQIADALQAAHAEKVIHRDVKPSNILVDGKGQAHLTDFGLARGTEDVGLTREGYAVGTPAYMPPEQALGQKSKIGPLSDVYSLGATLYTMVAGQPPYLGQTPEAILTAIAAREPVPPTQWAKALPRDLATIIARSMERAPERRYASAQEFGDDLRRFLAGEAIHARPVATSEKIVRFARRNRVVLGVGGSVGVLGLVVAIVLVFSGKKKVEEVSQQAKQEAVQAREQNEEEKKKIEEDANQRVEEAEREKEEERKRAEEERRKKEEAEAEAQRTEEERKRLEEEKRKTELAAKEEKMQAAMERERTAIRARRNDAQNMAVQIQTSSTGGASRRSNWPAIAEQYRELLKRYAEIATWLDRVEDAELRKRLSEDDACKELMNVAAEVQTAETSLLHVRVRGAWSTFGKQQDRGLADIDAILKEAPDHAEAGVTRGRMLYAMKKPKEAEAQFKAVAEKNPKWADAWLGLAEIHLDRKELFQADDCLTKAAESSPGDPDLRWLRGRYHYEKKQYEEALDWLGNSRTTGGQQRWGESAVLKARCFLALKRPKEAVESLEILVTWLKQMKASDLSSYSDDAEATQKERMFQIWATYGEALLEAGNKKDAQAALEKALEIKPGDSAAKKLLDRAKK